MRERKLFMVLGIVLAVLALGIAYAATLNVNLSITGTATAMASEENFDVKFTYVSPVTGTGEVDTSGSTAEISSDPTRGTFEFTGFITKGQTQSATWTISNENEAELYAHIVAYRELEVTDREYFRGRCDLASDVIEPNGTTTLTVTVECIKTPTSGTVSSGVLEFGFSAIASADEELEKDEEGNPIVPPGVIPTVCDHSLLPLSAENWGIKRTTSDNVYNAFESFPEEHVHSCSCGQTSVAASYEYREWQGYCGNCGATNADGCVTILFTHTGGDTCDATCCPVCGWVVTYDALSGTSSGFFLTAE